MFGISLSRRQVPDSLIEHFSLSHRICRRNQKEEEEVRFLDSDRYAFLPVWMNGQLSIVRWGNRDANSRLPKTQWCRVESLREGNWNWLEPVNVQVPATFCYDRGIWFLIKEGLQGVVVTYQGERTAYLISQPATHYYEVMTRNKRMPMFVGEII